MKEMGVEQSLEGWVPFGKAGKLLQTRDPLEVRNTAGEALTSFQARGLRPWSRNRSPGKSPSSNWIRGFSDGV